MAIKIFIDQGHNPFGHNTGAEGFGVKEQDITYNVGIELAGMLLENGNFEVRLSRNSPEEQLGSNNSTSLMERVRMANEWPADYFLSIHANANNNPNINGVEMYVYQAFTKAYTLGEALILGITSQINIKDNGVRINPSLYVLRKTKMPAVLAELAYLTNYENNQLLQSHQADFARGLYIGLISYFNLPNTAADVII